MRSEICRIKTGGMICRACSEAVEHALLQTRGVIKADVNYWKGISIVEYDPELVSREGLEKRINASGYTAGGSASGIWADFFCVVLTILLVWLMMTIPLNPIPKAETGAGAGFVFFIGLLTSTHCLAMCGGILLSQTTDASDLSGGEKNRKSGLTSALFYNGGRVLSYTAAGAVFGALGKVISYTAKTKGIVFVMVGLLVALIGMQMWGIFPGLRRLSPRQNSFCALPLRERQAYMGKPFIIGLLTGLMPCAPLYAMWLFAMSAGTALKGAADMFFFALGTVPLMFFFGALNSFIPLKWTKYMLKFSAVLVLSLGVKMLLKGLLLSGLI